MSCVISADQLLLMGKWSAGHYIVLSMWQWWDRMGMYYS